MKKTILIVGASGDIGIAAAKRLRDKDYQFVLHYHQNRAPIDAFMSNDEMNHVLAVLNADLSDEMGIQSFIEQLVFPVDAIIFASGSGTYGMFQDTQEIEMNKALNLHVKAPWLITKALLPHMIKQKFGKIVFITSIWGDIGASFEVIYSSVKGAQNSFVKALAKEVAISGVYVNAVSPGFIDTKMNQHLTNEEKGIITGQIPMNRAGTPDEIAYVIEFLLDQHSSYIQGEIIRANGAW